MTSEHDLEGRKSVNVLRVVLIGTVLAVPFAFWLQYAELVLREGLFATTSALPPPAIAGLFILAIVHLCLSAAGKRHWLPRSEILLIYIFLLITVALASYGLVQQLIMHLIGGAYNSSPQNDLSSVLSHTPAWVAPTNNELIRKLYKGAAADESYASYMIPMLKAWLIPLFRWSLLIVAIYSFVYCLALLVEEQWAVAERLKFPLLTPALELTAGGKGESRIFERGIMYSGGLWLGLGVAMFMNSSSFIQAWYEDYPGFTLFWAIKFDQPPWDAGSMYISYRPVALGIAYLAPTDISLSIWLFEFFKSAQRVFGAASGLGSITGTDLPGSSARFPYHSEQATGAFLLIAIVSLWAARRHVMRVFRALAGKETGPDTARLRWAVFGCVGSAVFIIIWLVVSGLFGGAIIAFLILLAVITLTFAKIRAAAGPPIYGIQPFRPDLMLISMVGTSSFGAASLAQMGVLGFLSKSYFPLLMATQLEGLKVARDLKIRRRDLTVVLFAALAVGFVVGTWSLFHVMYVQGADGFHSYLRKSPIHSYSTAAGYLKHVSGPDWFALTAVGVGALFTGGLHLLRATYWFWPLNPLGYAISQTNSTRHMWGMFFFAWLIKISIMRYGGVKVYRRTIPFFLGLIFGQMLLVIASNGLNIWLGTKIYVSAF